MRLRQPRRPPTAGFLFQKGALDFAGGTVVHINAGIAGLVGCLLVGKRKGYGTTAMTPHNVPLIMIGAALLWVGWFGFNVGSNLEANAFAAQVFINTFLATAAAVSRGRSLNGSSAARRRCSVLHRARSPAWSRSRRRAAGSARWARSIIGLLAGVVCLFAVTKLKSALGYDDSLDVFGVHCVGGILGALLTGVFNNPALGGTGIYDYVAGTWGYAGTGTQVLSQLWGVGVTVVWSGVVALIAFKIVDLVIGLRVSEEVETRRSRHGRARRARLQPLSRTLLPVDPPALGETGAAAPVFFCGRENHPAPYSALPGSVTQCSFRAP